MAKSAVPTINANQLLRLLEESGFVVKLATEPVLLLESTRPNAISRLRASVKIKGLILPDENRILINQELGLEERVKTVLHELIHLQAPEMSEAATEAATLALYRDLTTEQLGRFEFLVQ